MYKKFALSVLLLSPVMVMIADSLIPKSGAPTLQAAKDTSLPEGRHPAPGFDKAALSQSSPAIPAQGSPMVTAPMLDPKGIDPIPVSLDMARRPEPPSSEDVRNTTQDVSNDDRP